VFFNTSTEAKVDYLRFYLIIENDILKFYIPMSNISLMKVFQSVCKFFNYWLAIRFWKFL